MPDLDTASTVVLLDADTLREHLDALNEAGVHPIAVGIDAGRLQAVCRMLLDSGDITPMGVRMIEKVLNGE